MIRPFGLLASVFGRPKPSEAMASEAARTEGARVAPCSLGRGAGAPGPAYPAQMAANEGQHGELLREAIMHASEGFALYDCQDRLVLCNPRYKAIYAEIEEHLVRGATFEGIVRAGLDKGLYIEAIGFEEQWLQQRLHAWQEADVVGEQRLSNGRWLLVGDHRNKDGSRVVVRTDITELKRREEALLKSRQDMAEAIHALQEGFALFDQDDRLVICNQQYRQIFPQVADLITPGIKFEALIRAAAERGQNVEALASKEQWVEQRLEAHANPSETYYHRFTDGRWIRVSERRTSDGRTLATYVDISELKQREEELVRARDQAESANRIKSEFLATMSHELRTPLNSIIGFSDILQTRCAEQPELELFATYASQINESGQHLLSIINDILDISKIEAGKLEVREEQIELEELFSRATRATAYMAEQNSLSVINALHERPTVIWADPIRMTQILINLLSNAIKFTPAGGEVVLDFACEPDGTLLIQVTDSGIGMTAEEIPIALEPFRQIENALTRRFPGTGLGLSLTRSLVELHDGTLLIESAKDQGTKVSIQLPATRLLQPESLRSARAR